MCTVLHYHSSVAFSDLICYCFQTVFKKRNTNLERNAVRLCNIAPHHQVLEVGFGPGIGLEEAYHYIKGQRLACILPKISGMFQSVISF